MTGEMFVALLALVAVVVVLVWALVDHAVAEADESAGPVLLDQSGRLIAPTEELPVYTRGRDRAGRWSL